MRELAEARFNPADLKRYKNNYSQARAYAREKGYRILPVGHTIKGASKISQGQYDETRGRGGQRDMIDSFNNSNWLGVTRGSKGVVHVALASAYAAKGIAKYGFDLTLAGYADPPYYGEPPAPIWVVDTNRAGMQVEERMASIVEEIREARQGRRAVSDKPTSVKTMGWRSKFSPWEMGLSVIKSLKARRGSTRWIDIYDFEQEMEKQGVTDRAARKILKDLEKKGKISITQLSVPYGDHVIWLKPGA